MQVRVKVKLDANGIFSVEYAQMIETVAVKEEELQKEENKSETPKEGEEKKEGDDRKDEVCVASCARKLKLETDHENYASR